MASYIEGSGPDQQAGRGPRMGNASWAGPQARRQLQRTTDTPLPTTLSQGQGNAPAPTTSPTGQQNAPLAGYTGLYDRQMGHAAGMQGRGFDHDRWKTTYGGDLAKDLQGADIDNQQFIAGGGWDLARDLQGNQLDYDKWALPQTIQGQVDISDAPLRLAQFQDPLRYEFLGNQYGLERDHSLNMMNTSAGHDSSYLNQLAGIIKGFMGSGMMPRE